MYAVVMKWFTQWLHPLNMQWLYQNSRWVFGGCALLIIPGLWGAWSVSPDYQQGEAFRIIFCHVPASILSLVCYAVLAFSSLIFLIWRIRYYDFIAYCAAEAGTLMCALSLMTGMIWGRPIWGTYWLWDARLTSTAMLLGIYVCYHLLRYVVVTRESQRVISAVFALVGFVDIPIIHFSVYWWHSLHQGSTFFQSTQQTIPLAMSWPLWPMLIGLAGFLGLVASWRFEQLFLADLKWRGILRKAYVS